MKIVKGIINSILAFLLCVSFVAGFIVVLLSNTVLNEKYVLAQLAKNQFYEKVETDLKNGFEEYQYQSGFPETVFENLCSREMIEEDINHVVNYWYQGTELMNHSTDVELEIKANIEQYLRENAIDVTEKQEKNIQDFQKIIVQVYENKVGIVSNYSKQIANGIKQIKEVVEIASRVLIGAFMAILIIMLLINIKDFIAFVSTLGASLLASGILLGFVKFVIEKNIDIHHILIFTQSLSDLAKEMMYDVLNKIGWTGISLSIVGIVSIVVSNCRKMYKKEREE